MLWCRYRPGAQLPVEAWEGSRLVKLLIAFVPHGAESVRQSASLYQFSHHAESRLEVAGELVHRAAERFVAGIDDIAYLVDASVDGLDVAVLLRYGADTVDADAVHVVLVGIGGAYLAAGSIGTSAVSPASGGKTTATYNLSEDKSEHTISGDAANAIAAVNGGQDGNAVGSTAANKVYPTNVQPTGVNGEYTLSELYEAVNDTIVLEGKFHTLLLCIQFRECREIICICSLDCILQGLSGFTLPLLAMTHGGMCFSETLVVLP